MNELRTEFKLQSNKSNTTHGHSVYPQGPPPSASTQKKNPYPHSPFIQPGGLGHGITIGGVGSTADAASEFLNFYALPIEVQERIRNHKDPAIILIKSTFTRYKNNLTANSKGVLMEWNFVMFPLSSKKFLIT